LSVGYRKLVYIDEKVFVLDGDGGCSWEIESLPHQLEPSTSGLELYRQNLGIPYATRKAPIQVSHYGREGPEAVEEKQGKAWLYFWIFIV
jgi:hypothetical protein